MGTNCAPLVADLFLYSYEAEFVKRLLQAGKKHLAQQFNFTYRYIDDVLSLKNTQFAEYLEFIYLHELEIKETTEAAASSSYLDCYLYIDNGKLTTRLYSVSCSSWGLGRAAVCDFGTPWTFLLPFLRQTGWLQFSHCSLSIPEQ